jgi:hypothetical protein
MSDVVKLAAYGFLSQARNAEKAVDAGMAEEMANRTE